MLRQYRDVRDAAVVAHPAGGGELQIVGYVVWRDQGEPDVAALREHVRRRLPDAMMKRSRRAAWSARCPVKAEVAGSSPAGTAIYPQYNQEMIHEGCDK